MNWAHTRHPRIARSLAATAAAFTAGCIPDDPAVVAENVTTFIGDFLRAMAAAWLL